jgi:tRNA(Ile)-lysidine synthase
VQDERTSQLCKDIISSLDLISQLGRVYIAYSGGVDSHVLLHCCAGLPELQGRLTAVYIHHGLQTEAESWALHCEKITKNLGVDFITLRVNAKASQGESPEAAARNARYTALKSLIHTGDLLLLAQHREDQLETVLLQLFRGGGLRGLSGMPERMAFGSGVMLRPLLNTSKQAIGDYADAHQLSWVEDPSNQSNDYDRNFLRNQIMPLLKQRWPALDKTVSRSARHCANAQVLVEQVADGLFNDIFNPKDNTLCISRLTEHHRSSQQLIIRCWFGYLGLKMPAQAVVERILGQVVAAGKQRDPVLSEQGYNIRRYRDKLYCLVVQVELQDCLWPTGQTSIKIGPDQTLTCLISSTGILRERWLAARVDIKFRRGGEKIGLPGRQGHHALKNLFQEAGIPSWERDSLPLIYLDDQLAAIGERWISAEFYSEKIQGCISLSLQS